MMRSIWQRGQRGAWLLVFAAVTASAQDAVPTIEARLSDPVYMAWVSHQDLELCISCHYDGPNLGQVLANQGSGLTAFSRRQELERWLSADKHTIARRRVEPFAEDRTEDELTQLIQSLNTLANQAAERLLREKGITVDKSQIGLTAFPEELIGESNFLSRRICDKLGYDVETAEGYRRFRNNCLTCHGGYRDGETGFDLADTGGAQLGISCLYCHQLGDNEKWVADHAAPRPEENWRLLPPEKKEEAGMRHLAGTSSQADLCFDCHVGNRGKNMFVTHEMYAAGHPPIPSIELQTFCRQMPQHWQTPSQLYESLRNFARRDEYFRKNYPGVVDEVNAGETFWNTRKMLVGALTARRKALDLFIESAEPNQQGVHEKWADYALYDCAACHHELESDSQRQQRGFPGAPGRPRQHEWPETLLEIAYIFYGKETLARTRQLESQLEMRFGEKPFGHPQRVQDAAEELRKQVTDALKEVERKPVTAETARRVLIGLARTPEEEMLTYDSGRQVVWAMQTIVDELENEGSPVSPQVAAVVQRLGDSETAGIASDLPAGRRQFIYSDQLEADLKRRAQYRPARLKMQLNELNRLLAASGPAPPTLVSQGAKR